MKDASGWMPGVARVDTVAWGYPDVPEDQMYPKAVVSHVAQGYMAGLLGIAQSPDPGKSWHFSIGRDGTVVQHVSIWDPAWHAGDVNTPTWSKLERLRVETGFRNPNKFTIGVEHEGFSVDPGYGYDYLYSGEMPWPEPLIEASRRVHDWVFASCANIMVRSEATVITHSMLNSRSRAQDPGDLWLATVRPRLISERMPVLVGPDATATELAQARAEGYAEGVVSGRGKALDEVRGFLAGLE